MKLCGYNLQDDFYVARKQLCCELREDERVHFSAMSQPIRVVRPDLGVAYSLYWMYRSQHYGPNAADIKPVTAPGSVHWAETRASCNPTCMHANPESFHDNIVSSC